MCSETAYFDVWKQTTLSSGHYNVANSFITQIHFFGLSETPPQKLKKNKLFFFLKIHSNMCLFVVSCLSSCVNNHLNFLSFAVVWYYPVVSRR